MNETAPSLIWEAPEHRHIEKTNDWFWIVGILSLASSVTSIIFDNVLFAIVIILATFVVFITGNKKPRTIQFEVSARGIRVDDTLYPYTTLDSYYLDEESPEPQLILKSKKMFVPLIVVPLHDHEGSYLTREVIDTIEAIVRSRLPEEHLEEPFAHKLLEYLGF